VLDVFGTEEDGLYQSGRVFPSDQLLPAGYRVPLPPGRYRVAVHFAAVHWLEDRRAFDIRLEGITVKEDFDLGASPFRTAIVQVFEIEVTDGFLDLELALRKGVPRISAIEVLKMGASSPKG